jgi:ribosomal protein S18 acetylase RimI-like enzyme
MRIAMEFEWQYSQEGINWKELSELYKLAPLGNKRPEDLEKAFSNSMFKCFVFKSNKLVGVGRALADGIDCSYICDVAILPDYQNMGIGKEIVTRLIEFSKGHNKIILYSNPGKEGFYHRLGFQHMSTAMAIFENQEQAVKHGYIQQS